VHPPPRLSIPTPPPPAPDGQRPADDAVVGGDTGADVTPSANGAATIPATSG
jgi:hypothetical protein